MVFREFLALVEERFGEDAVDDIIDASDLPSGGAYTSVGTYHHGEMIALVTQLSERTSLPVRELLHVFAEHLMRYFFRRHPEFFGEAGDALSFIERVDRHIHVEVRKLYPDAELPAFSSVRRGPDELEIVYRSFRPFRDLAHGLMLASASYFDETLDVTMGEVDEEGGVLFTVRRKAA